MKQPLITLLLAAVLILTSCTPETTPTTPTLPEGYTLDHYTIEETLEATCTTSADCTTPMEYLVQSRCPFTTICLDNACTVVCPEHEDNTVTGTVTNIQQELDGIIVTIDDNGATHKVLLSIPNLGPEGAEPLSKIAIGTYIQARGTSIALEEETMIIAHELYAAGTMTDEHPCNLTPDPGTCEAAITKYYYDAQANECKSFSWGGCDGTVPFDLKEVCVTTCVHIPEEQPLTQQRCETEGGRVTNTSTERCRADERSIGSLDNDSARVCCMPVGGSDSKA